MGCSGSKSVKPDSSKDKKPKKSKKKGANGTHDTEGSDQEAYASEANDQEYQPRLETTETAREKIVNQSMNMELDETTGRINLVGMQNGPSGFNTYNESIHNSTDNILDYHEDDSDKSSVEIGHQNEAPNMDTTQNRKLNQELNDQRLQNQNRGNNNLPKIEKYLKRPRVYKEEFKSILKGFFTGKLMDGKEHGEGQFLWDDGYGYQGNFEFGAMEGNGVFGYIPSTKPYVSLKLWTNDNFRFSIKSSTLK